MPSRPLRPCTKPGCPTLVGKGHCEAHTLIQRQESERHRLSYRERGYGQAWRVARREHLRAHPLCWYCEQKGRTRAANTVDHHVPHKGDPKLFNDRSNWRSSCASCHSAKTARQDGGYGNRVNSLRS